MRLGEMLVHDGRLTDAQLQQALAAQAKDGGRLGTVLFELGFISLDALTVYLGLELGIPIATGAMLERSKSPARRLLTPEAAYRFKCVPIVLQDRQLIAAVEDPHDFAMLEELAHQTGYRVLPRVAPEVRIYYYVELFYRVARPARFVKFGDAPRGRAVQPDPKLPAPPLPGLPPVPVAPVAAPGPKPQLRAATSRKLFEDPESESLELEAEDLILTLEADEPPEPTGPHRVVRSTDPPPIGEAVAPLAADAAIAALKTVTDRDRMIDTLLGYAAGAFDVAVLFTVREQMAFGWKAIGELPGRAYVEHVLLPLGSTSIVQAAVAADGGVFHGPPSPSTLNTYLYKVLGCPEPPTATAATIAIGKRVVNVLYGHGKELTPLQLDQLRELCEAAAEAYARLIAVRKKK